MINNQELQQAVQQINTSQGEKWFGYKRVTTQQRLITMLSLPLLDSLSIQVTLSPTSNPWCFQLRVTVGDAEIFETQEVPTWIEQVQHKNVNSGFTIHFAGNMQITLVNVSNGD